MVGVFSLGSRFTRFVRRHGMAHHYRSTAVWEHRHRTEAAPLEPVTLALSRASQLDTSTLLLELGSSPHGLSEAQAQALRHQHGPNEVSTEGPVKVWAHLWHCYASPFNLLLTTLGGLSYLTQDHRAAGVISAMVLLSSGLRFVQEHRSNRAADALRARVSNRATVLRPTPATEATDARVASHPVDIPLQALVPGDVVCLSAGDMVPADLRLLSAKDLFVSQAAMTGESMPVEKFAHPPAPDASLLERDNLLFMGTNVLSGTACAVVVATGGSTCYGEMARHMEAHFQPPTAFEAGLNQVSGLLIRFMVVMVPTVFLLSGWAHGNWLQAFLFALSIAVGLTPEMLPMIVTSTLAKGAVALSSAKVIVKRLDAIHNFGAMDVLCADKTGTLTQDHIVLERHTDAWGQPSESVLRLAWLNSHFQTGLKNLLDVAVLQHAEIHQALEPARHYAKVDEIPFDFQRRRMSVIVAERGQRQLLICKGALEEVLAVCTHIQLPSGATVALLAPHLAQVRQATAALNEQGLRVVAVAVREEPAAPRSYGVSDESGLTLMGYVSFLDPPKDSAAQALAALRGLGVQVKILTGDNERITAKVCRDVGLNPTTVVSGPQIDGLTEAELTQTAQRAQVFVRLSPQQKERLVLALRRGGHVVGFLGDGINDAPALRAADIGISVDSAVDIAKQSADIILLEKSLLVLQEGVIQGRRTFCNLLKYLRMTASSNFGNVLSVLVCSAFLPFLPMLPLQLLLQNLLYDLSQTPIPFDHVDAESTQAPLRWQPAEMGRFMLWFGPVSSVFDLLTFALLWWGFGIRSVSEQAGFQSAWFVEGLLSQTLVVHLIRTRKLPFLESRAAWPLTLMTMATMALGVVLVMSDWGQRFHFQPLPLGFFAALAVLLLGYATLVQLTKRHYAQRYGWA